MGNSSSSDDPLYLAIDAGGTKTDFLMANSSREWARVRGGCIKRMRVDEKTAWSNLTAALAALSEKTGRSLREVTRTCIGTAGDTVPLVVDWLRSALPEQVSGELVIVGDVEIALDAAFRGGPGVLVLAGTGSNVAARGVDGRLLGAGGWGPLMADQGSANRIGLNGLRAGFLAKDELRPTALLREAMRFWQLASEHDLIAFANTVPAPDFSKLAMVVTKLAALGDTVAQAVLDREGSELGYLVRLVLRRMHGEALPNTLPDTGKPLRIAFSGSVMEHATAVRRAVLAEVHGEFAGAEEVVGVVDPLLGALWRARTPSV
ncbi:MAG: ATPase [Rhodospirillales bacterium]|nr:ATPase [Acetobacter sp.]